MEVGGSTQLGAEVASAEEKEEEETNGVVGGVGDKSSPDLNERPAAAEAIKVVDTAEKREKRCCRLQDS